MTDKKLTKKQEAFVNAYLGDASFNATKAAEMAGYSSPAASGHENLKNPQIKARINEHLDTIRDEGIGNRAVRLAALNDLYDGLVTIRRERGEDAKAKYANGEYVPEGAETGLMMETKKQFGTGANAAVETVWEIDKTLVREAQNVLEQAAKEVGDRDKRLIELSGPEGGPVQIESAKDKLLALCDDDAEP